MDEQDFVFLTEKDVSGYNEPGLLPLPEEEFRTVLQWLNPTDYLSDSSELNKHLTSHVPGTGDWILRTEEYMDWHRSTDFGSLWIKAIPGAGKSVLAASLVAKLAETEHVPVIYFFFRQIIAANREPQHLVRDWLTQILRNVPSLQLKLFHYVESHRELDSVSFDELWQVLVDAISLMPKVYCIADGLDEMNLGNDRFLYQLLELGQHKPSSIKVIMTSRLIPRIEKVLKHSTVVHLSLFEQAVNNDITYYVRSRLQSTSISEPTRQIIQETLSAKAEGLFLYARLMLDDILDPSRHDLIDAEHIHDTLSHLPSNLADMYNGMLADHSSRSGTSRETQFTILQWVTQSSRPLRLLELSAMIDFLNDTAKASRDTKAIVRAGCGPLLEILEDETVSIIHHSFTEFLTDSTRIASEAVPTQFPVIDCMISQRAMALTCLRYMISNALDNWKIQGRPDREEHYNSMSNRSAAYKMQLPFLDYAAENWHQHVANSSDEILFSVLDEFLRSDSKSFSAWLDMRWPAGSLKSITPLHVAAFTGLSHYTQHLLQKGLTIDILDGYGRSPISWAASNGNAEVVRVLLENGAQADLDDDVGLKPLHYAAQANRASVVEILLEVGVDPLTPKTKEYPGRRCGNAPRSTGETAVKYAAEYGHVETMSIFIKTLTSAHLNQALHWAIKSGKTEVVCTLLGSPIIDINNLERGATPLFHAASARNPKMIRALLEKGADVSIHCCPHSERERRLAEDHFNPKLTVMHSVCGCFESYTQANENDLRQAFKLLHDAGCDINAIGPSGMTPLHYAVSQEFDSVSSTMVALLLENGANAAARDNDGNTPLHLVKYACRELVDLLCKHGGNINDTRKIDGKTPIHTALESTHPDDLLAMLEYNPHPDIRDLDGNTVLHIAVQRNRLDKESIAGLLHAGYDVNARNNLNEIPLHAIKYLCGQSKPGLMMIIDAGANLEAKDIYGYTVLVRAMERSASIEIVQTLLEGGSDINARDQDGKTLLHLACRSQNVNSVQFLVDAGGNPLVTDHAGSTILHEAAELSKFDDKRKHRQFFETIFRLLGSAVGAKNNKGRTVLHVAAGIKSDDSDWRGIVQESMDLLLELTHPLQMPLSPDSTLKFLDINARDNDCITPIHIAATTSAKRVDQLIRAGADVKVLTIEGQSPLHVACRAGQSNTVGLLVDHYAKHKQLDFMEHADTRGRTALFEACVSGRVESVTILLDAGANLHHEDEAGGTPLNACAEFQDKGFVIKNDLIRPRHTGLKDYGMYRTKLWNIPEPDTAGIRQIVRLLIARGAKVGSSQAIDPRVARQPGCGPLDSMYLAVAARNEVMVEELDSSDNMKFLDPNEELQGTYPVSFEKEYFTLRSKNVPGVLKTCVTVGDDNLAIVTKLLILDNEAGIVEVARLGADLIKPAYSGETCLHLLARCGRTSLLERIGCAASMVSEAWIEEKLTGPSQFRDNICPILHTACERALPNFDTISLLVGKLKVEVNARSRARKELYHQHYVPGPTALHVLSRGQYWWQPQAIQILLRYGADIESKDENDETALQVAMADKCPRGYWMAAAAEILLEFGANSNVIDDKGLTCLNRAKSNVTLVRKLIEKGADINLGRQPAIFSAIEAMDTEILRVLLSNRADCNSRRVANSTADTIIYREGQVESDWITENEMFPVHFAASRRFNNTDSRSKALDIIDLLLHAGANPFEVYATGTSILHDLIRCGGILEPFLDLKELDMEARDSLGRTLLLIACAFDSPSTDVQANDAQSTVAELLHSMGANLEAVDYRGRTIFHHLTLCSHHDPERYKRKFIYFLSQPTGAKLAMQKDNEGFSPLHDALRKFQPWTVETLLENGADPLEADPDWNTAIHHLTKGRAYAYGQGLQTKWIERFLGLGVDINARDKLGETAAFNLMASSAMQEGDMAHERQLAFLTDNGADLQVRNFKGETLLHITAKRIYGNDGDARRNAQDIVNTFKNLVRLGLDPMLEDNDQRTALDVAAACGNEGILALFKRGNQVDIRVESGEESDV
ncbi:hypothetical protein MMC11_005164, partial [Xylographa trunciseda]|nr:hypothetical protein [Xylographa trunciseda]